MITLLRMRTMSPLSRCKGQARRVVLGAVVQLRSCRTLVLVLGWGSVSRMVS